MNTDSDRQRLLRFHALGEQLGGALADQDAALIDGGKRHAQQVGIMHVAGADDGDILRHAHAEFERGFDRACGDGVVVAEDAIGPRDCS